MGKKETYDANIKRRKTGFPGVGRPRMQREQDTELHTEVTWEAGRDILSLEEQQSAS